MTVRKINFNPGPTALPEAVLEEAQAELLDYQGTGLSILEHSHRGPAFMAVHEEAKSLLRELLGIPSTHRVLFMQGGARGQFALVPMNLLREGSHAEYINTGVWGEKALAEAQRLGEARETFSGKDADGQHVRVPTAKEVPVDSRAAYVHITSNNTLYGTQFHELPETGSVPLIADMSSDIASRPVDVAGHHLIYAGAQKNLGPAGVTLVIIHEALLVDPPAHVPQIFRYREVAKADSLQNTPPTFAIYLMRNQLRWLKAQGGVQAMAAVNEAKAKALYGVVDGNPAFFRSPVEVGSRSQMNVVFRLPSDALEAQFLKEADAAGMVGLRGHRLVGGIRVSLYNAIPRVHVERLASFMRDFAHRST